MATYTFDVFATLDGYGSYDEPGDWGGYWGKQGPEFLAHRLETYSQPQHMVFGATTFREFMDLLSGKEHETPAPDPWVVRMKNLPTTVISSTIHESGDWPQVTIAHGDAVTLMTHLKQQSHVPLRSHGSLSLNRALLAAGVVDFLQITIFPVITGQTGTRPIFEDVADFDLTLLESKTFDHQIQELTYVPTLHKGRARHHL